MNLSNIKNTWKGIHLLINGKTRGDNVITALKGKNFITTALELGIDNDWFHSYLTDCVQSTQIG